MPKSVIYIQDDLKQDLEAAAQEKGSSVAELLEHISRAWLHQARAEADNEEQLQLHAAAATHFGTIQGSDPERASNASRLIKAKLGKPGG